MAQVLHGWSVDVEDWFHILDCDGAPDPEQWDRTESRVGIGTRRMLDLLDRFHYRATFFCLGWIARKAPELVAEIAARGHEIGSHGDMHRLVHTLDRDTFARDLDASLESLKRACGHDIHAFRAPGFSIGDGETWALPILASRGITLDASLFLARRAHGGMRLERTRPFDLVLHDGRVLTEVPTVPRILFGREVPFSGGGYLRLLPIPVLVRAFAEFDETRRPVIAYVHPRELDPQQPRMDLPARRRFKYYVGLDTVTAKIERLFEQFHFGTLSEVAAACPRDRPVHVGRLA
jgi:polysaccharide deacetylase family protein (PEP-CTERM system associated)